MRSAVIILVILALIAVTAFLAERWRPPGRPARVLAPRRHPARRLCSRARQIGLVRLDCGCLSWAEDAGGTVIPVTLPCHQHAERNPLLEALEKELNGDR